MSAPLSEGAPLPQSATLRCGRVARESPTPIDVIVLRHDERRIRRKRLVAQHGDAVLVDLPHTTTLRHGDRLMLDDGRAIEVIACEETLWEVRGRDAAHLLSIAWQIGNRHLAAQIEAERVLILHDAVIGEMLEGLGAALARVSEPFDPEGGAYDHHH